SFISYLKYYKTIFPGEVIEIGRFDPTSQVCSACGNRQQISLSQRVFNCTSCKNEMDRDLNAAINIRNIGAELLQKKVNNTTVGQTESYAFGDGVRPLLVFERGGAVVDELGTTRSEVASCNQ